MPDSRPIQLPIDLQSRAGVWPLLRIGYLAAAFLGLVILGGWRLLAHEDPVGLACLIAGAAAILFLPRRGLPAAVGLGMALDGLLGARTLESTGGLLAAALAIAPVQASGGEADAAIAQESGEATDDGRVHITTIGTFQLRAGARDYAPTLFQYPSLTFCWAYLLARWVREPGKLSARAKLGQEAYPTLKDEGARRRNVRKRLDALRKLPGPISALIREEGSEAVGLDLSECDLDVDRLRRLRERCLAAGALLQLELLEEAERELAAVGFHEFLVGFEDWQQAQTAGQGTSGNLVRDLRLEIDGWRADIVRKIADTRLARDEPARVVSLLEVALERSPEREDLAKQLAAAYAHTGQIARAADVRNDYHLSEV